MKTPGSRPRLALKRSLAILLLVMLGTTLARAQGSPPPPPPPPRPTPPPPPVWAPPVPVDRSGDRLKAPNWDEVKAKHLARLDEAARRAENLMTIAGELEKDLAKRGSRRTYQELAGTLGETGASMRHVVSGLRALLNDPAIGDPELRNGPRGRENMEELITGLLATLKQAERLPPSLVKVSGP